MKLGKLSLVAVMALGTSAFAIDNVKVNGDAKLWYQTSEYSGAGAGATTSQDFFDNTSNTNANIKVSVGAMADLLKNLTAGIKVTALTTLGIENNLIGATSTAKVGQDGTSHQTATDDTSFDDQAWTEEAYLAYSADKTVVKIGRQRLDTPLAFSETWNVVDNTFEAAVLINNNVPDTTLVGAWIGNHNGMGLANVGRGTTVAMNGEFDTFAAEGTYFAGAINKSIPNTTVQAWYYSVPEIATAYWLQADAKLIDMVTVGVQYAGMNTDSTSDSLTTAAANHRDTNMYAIKGAVDVAGVNLYAAYSSVRSE
ncbi:MAG: hypothetical protein QG558_1338, partial [Campylobacterota bacterium]|nr:hypothetical protein [Campylobacterota bacterium]